MMFCSIPWAMGWQTFFTDSFIPKLFVEHPLFANICERHKWPLFKDTYSGRGSKKPTDNFRMRQGRPSPRTGKMDGLSPWPWCIWCRLVPEAHCWVFLVSLHGMEEGDDICFGIGVVLKFKYVEACSTVTSGYLSPQWCGNGKDASAMHGSFFLTRPLLGTFCEYISLLLLL